MTTTQRWTMVAAILGSSVVFLDGTIVNVALPKIGETLPATLVSVLEGQTYVASGYLATLAALLILAGAVADYYGRRRVFAIGLAGFGITSMLCAFAPNLELLSLFRVLQGATGALLVPGSLSIITATFDGEARARSFGIWAASTSGLLLFGPIIGGVLVTAVSWRAAFFINAPLVILGLWATLRHMEETRDESATGRFDWLGACVAVVAVGGLAFGAIRGEAQHWGDLTAFGALGIGAVATLGFPFLMTRRPNPLVPLELFRSRVFTVINVSTLLIYGALYVSVYFQTLFLQGVLGYTPVASGMIGVPTGILLTVLSTRIGALAGRIGPRPFLVAGPLVMAAGLLWMARIPSNSPAWAADIAEPASLVPPTGALLDVLPSVLAFGVGISLVVAPLTSALMSSVAVRFAGVASAINNAVSRVGSPLMSAIIFIVVSGTFYSTLAAKVPGVDPASPELRQMVQPINPPKPDTPQEVREAGRAASTDAFHVASIACAALLVAGAAVNYVGLRGEPRDALPGEGPAAGDPDPGSAGQA
ncbi:MAG TPA: MFS transporter [Candidatus Limnocylindrales bacterium]|nr:MFS transporter [Candidatus Limnocylindrales bacterium]